MENIHLQCGTSVRKHSGAYYTNEDLNPEPQPKFRVKAYWIGGGVSVICDSPSVGIRRVHKRAHDLGKPIASVRTTQIN